jgi:hypothetical protein
LNFFETVYKKFHKYDDVDVLTDEELVLLDKYGMEDQKDLKRRNEKVYFYI